MMRNFNEIQKELELKKFLDSPLGTLYFVPYALGKPRIIVRYFDGELPPYMTGTFASLTKATQEWLDEHTYVGRFVRIAQPIEIGADFIAREHFTYYTSTESYVDYGDELPAESPVELMEMRDVFRNEYKRDSDEKESIVKDVLARSLLEPTGKTYFREDERRFIIVELKPTKFELERWQKLVETIN